MADSAGWKPKKHPSSLQLARNARTLPSGVLRLRNDSNAFWSQIFAWGLLAMAALLLNRSIVTDTDPMAPTEVVAYAVPLCGASVLAVVILGRTQVLIHEERLEIRNPVRRYRADLSAVTGVEPGALGFPTLGVAGHQVRLMGLEESPIDRMSGGSEELKILRDVLDTSKQAAQSAPNQPLDVGLNPLDRPLVLILAGWAIYGLSFLF